jgi:hypothetical protein
LKDISRISSPQVFSLKFCCVTRYNEILLIIAMLVVLSWNFLFMDGPKYTAPEKCRRRQPTRLVCTISCLSKGGMLWFLFRSGQPRRELTQPSYDKCAYCVFSGFSTSPLKLEIGLLYFVSCSTKTHRLSFTDISLHREIIAVYSETHTKYINTDNLRLMGPAEGVYLSS